jgi:hypothetical protein
MKLFKNIEILDLDDNLTKEEKRQILKLHMEANKTEKCISHVLSENANFKSSIFCSTFDFKADDQNLKS